MVGTKGFQAPEMLSKEGYGFPVDLFSLGKTLQWLSCSSIEERALLFFSNSEDDENNAVNRKPEDEDEDEEDEEHDDDEEDEEDEEVDGEDEEHDEEDGDGDEGQRQKLLPLIKHLTRYNPHSRPTPTEALREICD